MVQRVFQALPKTVFMQATLYHPFHFDWRSLWRPLHPALLRQRWFSSRVSSAGSSWGVRRRCPCTAFSHAPHQAWSHWPKNVTEQKRKYDVRIKRKQISVFTNEHFSGFPSPTNCFSKTVRHLGALCKFCRSTLIWN